MALDEQMNSPKRESKCKWKTEGDEAGRVGDWTMRSSQARQGTTVGVRESKVLLGREGGNKKATRDKRERDARSGEDQQER